MIRVSYQKGSYTDLAVSWRNDGALVDLHGYDLSLRVFPYGGTTAFTKTEGITVVDLVDGVVQDPNLTVQWSTDAGEELDDLDVDTEYGILFTATPDEGAPLEMVGLLIVRNNAPNIGYCEVTDLLLGDLDVEGIDKYAAVNSAAAEMDGELGQRYILPLDLTVAPDWVTLKLKTINQNLATGRIICAQAVGGEDSKLNAYGESLLNLAYGELAKIVCGDIRLSGLTVDPTSFRSTAPIVSNRDAASAVDDFEELFMRRRLGFVPGWRPGP